MARRYYLRAVAKTLSGWNKRTQNIQILGKSTRVFKRYIFFHVFTSENMGDTSVLVYGETSIKP